MNIAENSAETATVPIENLAIRQPFLYAILTTAQHQQEQLDQFQEKKEKKAFIGACGGASRVQPFQNFKSFWESLTVELQTKITNIPSGVIQQKEWFALAKLTVEQVMEWCQGIVSRSQQQIRDTGSKIISPKAWIEGISNFSPKSKPKKTSLKLGEPLENEDFNILLHKKEYDFTPENLEEFRAKVLASADLAIPITTEDLFPFLQHRGLNPLLILSPRDRDRFEFQQKLEEKDKELKEVRSQFNKLNQKLEQRDEQLQLQQQQINQLTQDKQELKQQNQAQQSEIDQLKQQMQEFKQFMEASKAAA